LTPTLVYLSLGSNLGDRAANLRAAIAALSSANFRVQKVSSFYETEPVGYLDQPWFFNCVVEGETDSQPIELLHALRAIEFQLGSKKAFAKGPRRLDIDILLLGDLSLDTPELQIPHPRRNRASTPTSILAGNRRRSPRNLRGSQRCASNFLAML
jgi:2-amino-4-hydroxy-6-hydroxymethyldihydropteridine diphosphokinase